MLIFYSLPLRSGAVKPQHLGEMVQADITRVGAFQARSLRGYTGIQPCSWARACQHRGTHHRHPQRTRDIHQQVTTVTPLHRNKTSRAKPCQTTSKIKRHLFYKGNKFIIAFCSSIYEKESLSDAHCGILLSVLAKSWKNFYCIRNQKQKLRTVNVWP